MQGDAIAALFLWEDGDGQYGPVDRVAFSWAPGSPTLARITAGPADILVPGSPTVFVRASRLGLQPSDEVGGLNSRVTQRDRPRPAGILGPVIGRPDGSRPAGEACRLVSRVETNLAPTPALLAYTADIPLEDDLRFGFTPLLYTIVDEDCKCNYGLRAFSQPNRLSPRTRSSSRGLPVRDRCAHP
jgi:hypothetical protein